MRARDIMTTDPVTVPPETPLEAVAALMADRAISGLPWWTRRAGCSASSPTAT